MGGSALDRNVDVLVIGAGQAGLAMGYYLKDLPLSFALLDANPRVGDTWRTRYDSLVLFTPRTYSALPGLKLSGDPAGYPGKDELADYLETYADHFDLPVHLNTSVQRLERAQDGFHVLTNQGTYQAKQVVIATGPFQKPFIPNLQGTISDDVYQTHTAFYTNPSQLKPGPVLVVGAGNSGVQIAAELCEERDVYLSIGKKMKIMPSVILNRSLFWWFDVLGLSKATVDSTVGKILSQNDPIIGTEIKPLLKQGKVKSRGRAQSVRGREVQFADGQTCTVDNIIWATGFEYDHRWIDVPGVIDNHGSIVHERGVTKVKGLYFLGLPWQYRRGSALLLGVHQDAQFLAETMSAGHNQAPARPLVVTAQKTERNL